MLRRTRFFLFGAIVATPVAAITSVVASAMILSIISDEELETFNKFIHHLREM